MPVRVMLVDDHPIVLGGLESLLRGFAEFEVVGLATDGDEAVNLAERVGPDVVVMDVMMPGKDGIEACRDLMMLLPDTRVLMLTASAEERAVVEAVAAGAAGYLQKFTGPEELVTALRDVAHGHLRVPADAVRRAFSTIQSQPAGKQGRDPARLTTSEEQILALFSSGKSYAQVAEATSRSPTTVRNTIYRIQDKLGFATKQEIVVWAVRSGLLDRVQGELN